MTEKGFKRAKEVKHELNKANDFRNSLEKSYRFETDNIGLIPEKYMPISSAALKQAMLEKVDKEINDLENEFRRLY